MAIRTNMIVRFNTPRYNLKGNGTLKRKATVHTEPSHNKKMEKGCKICVQFKGLRKDRKRRKRGSRQTLQKKKKSKESEE